MFDDKYIMKHVKSGNLKLPKSTWIFNSGSAHFCPSFFLGLCQVAGLECYALRAEMFRPAVLPYRERQREIIDNVLPIDFAWVLQQASERARVNKLKTFRMNESGDFRDQEDVDWFATVARWLSTCGVKSYVYTARTDLDLNLLVRCAGLNVSNSLNGWQTKGANRFKTVDKFSHNHLKCHGNCGECTLCYDSEGLTIEILKH